MDVENYTRIPQLIYFPTFSSQKGDEGRETTKLVTKLGTWDKDRRFVVSRELKPEKGSVQLSFLEGSDFKYFYFVTNTEMASEKVVIASKIIILV